MSNEFSMFDLAPGKSVLDRFEIVRATRQNDLALTFDARDAGEGGEECELTFFPPALFDDPGQVEEFCAFWQAWRNVASRHVTRVRDIIPIAGECALIVTEAAPGRSLRDRVEGNEPMEITRVLRLGVQLAQGLVEIHGAGLVHGDLKPQTIHLTADDEDVVMVGGGVTTGIWNAKGLGERTALIGTPYYAPIEQFGGESPDVRSDIYNVAAVLFELATGALPWPGKTFLEVFQAKLDKAPPSMQARAPGIDVPADAEAAIVKGLLADRNQRYASAEELLAGLTAVS